MNAGDVYDGKDVFCNSRGCHLKLQPMTGTVFHCVNEHDYCPQCADPKDVKIEMEQQSEGQPEAKDESDIDVLDEDDTDSRSKTIIKCPLSRKEMTNPYKSKKCGHVFEMEAILNYIEQNKHYGVVECPQHGCSKNVKETDFEKMNVRKRRRSSLDTNPRSSKKRKLSVVDLTFK